MNEFKKTMNQSKIINSISAISLAIALASCSSENNEDKENKSNLQSNTEIKKETEAKKTLTESERVAIINNLEILAKTIKEKSNNKEFLKATKIKSIEVQAITDNINLTNIGGLEITINVKNENINYKNIAKQYVEAILDNYKKDTQQDPLFKVSAKLFADTHVESIKHYFARAKYLPEMSPMVLVDDKDILVSID